jgi:hypothetical protein
LGLGFSTKQTGSGFIRVVEEGGEGGSDDIRLQNGHDGAGGMAYTGFRSNPATNDWVPNVDEDQVLLLMIVIIIIIILDEFK